MKKGKTTAVSWHRSLVPDPENVTRNPRVGWVLDLLQSIEDGQADELQTRRLGLRGVQGCALRRFMQARLHYPAGFAGCRHLRAREEPWLGRTPSP